MITYEVEETLRLGEKIKGYICDTAELANRALDEGKSVLFEGARHDARHRPRHVPVCHLVQRDLRRGPPSGQECLQPRFATFAFRKPIPRVGGGPFLTEMPDLEAGSSRAGQGIWRCHGGCAGGWFDLAELRYAKMINGIDSLVVTSSTSDTQWNPCASATPTRARRSRKCRLPPRSAGVTPVYKTLPGWCESTYGLKDALSSLRRLSTTPLCLDYSRSKLHDLHGPERDATIIQPGTLLARWPSASHCRAACSASVEG